VRPIYRRFPARDGQRFMAELHDFAIVEAFHEPTRARHSLREMQLAKSWLAGSGN